MPWIKRNLALAVSALVSLALLGFGGWYLWSERARNATLDEEIGAAKSEHDRLLRADPFPSRTNVDAARKEIERVNNFIRTAGQVFSPAPPPAGPLNNQTFKSILQTTVAGLQQRAHSAGIRLSDTNYYFSFEAQRLPVVFPPESLQPLYERLKEVEAITTVLFESRINQLLSVRRAPVPGETRTGDDYLEKMMRVDQEAGAEIWPYEFTIYSFTPELADVLEGLARLRQMALVKIIEVSPAVVRDLEMDGARKLLGGDRQPPPLQRQRGVRPGVQPGRPQPELKTLLEEQPLRIVLQVEVIKLTAEAAQAKTRGGPQ